MAAQKIWFITGISRGFGKVLAQELLSRGDVVIGTTRDGRTDLAPGAGTLHVLPLDVRDRDAIFTTAASAHALHGRIDVVVNNAGYGLMGAVEECSPAEVEDVMAVNFFGTLHVTQAMLPYLRRQRNGHIVNLSSIAGLAPSAGAGLYAAAKFAVEGMSEALAQEVKPLGIKVTIVEPGAFRTDFLEKTSIRLAAASLPDYDATRGELVRNLTRMAGNQAGDPVLAVRAIIRAVESPNPPLHLVLGADAFRRVRTKLDAFMQDLSEWERVGLSTAFEEVGK